MDLKFSQNFYNKPDEPHFYEEINELPHQQHNISPTASIKSTNSLLTSTSTSTSSSYTTNSLSSNDNKSIKRVRFSSSKSDTLVNMTSPQHTDNNNNNNNHKKSIFKRIFSSSNSNSITSIELLNLNKNSILKNNSNDRKSSSVSSSTSSLLSTTPPPSTVSEFNELVDEFVTRYACKLNKINHNCDLCNSYKTISTSPSSSTTTTTTYKSNTPSTMNTNDYNNYFVIDENCLKLNDRLSFRVTNLTLNEIKMKCNKNTI